MESDLLKDLAKNDIENSLLYARSKNIDHTQLIGLLTSLSLEGYLITENLKMEEITLTQEGQDYLQKGSPEAQVFNLVKARGKISQADLNNELGQLSKIGFSQAMKNKWLSLEKESKLIVPAADSIEDKVQESLRQIVNGEESKETDALVKRKLAEKFKRGYCKVTKGPEFREARVEVEADITYELLKSGGWKTAEFKNYNFNALGKIQLEGICILY